MTSDQPAEMFKRATGYDFSPQRNVAFQRGREAGVEWAAESTQPEPSNPYESLTVASFHEDLFDLWSQGYAETSGLSHAEVDYDETADLDEAFDLLDEELDLNSEGTQDDRND